MKLNEFMANGDGLDPRRDRQLNHRQSVAPQPQQESFGDKVAKAAEAVKQQTGLRIQPLHPDDPSLYVVACPKGPIIAQVRFQESDGEISMRVVSEIETPLRVAFKKAARELGIGQLRPY